jgi:hypothetical protein
MQPECGDERNEGRQAGGFPDLGEDKKSPPLGTGGRRLMRFPQGVQFWETADCRSSGYVPGQFLPRLCNARNAVPVSTLVIILRRSALQPPNPASHAAPAIQLPSKRITLMLRCSIIKRRAYVHMDVKRSRTRRPAIDGAPR